MSIFKPKSKQIVEVNWQLPNADNIPMDTIYDMFDKKPEWILYAIRQKRSALKDLERQYNACVFSGQRPSKAGNIKTINNMKVTTKIANGKRVVDFDKMCKYFPITYKKCVTPGKSYRKIYLSPLNAYDDLLTKLKNA